jgi:hypothetical protein
MIAWPEVQPLAYRVPNPIINPPITIKIKPLSVKSDEKLKTSTGIKPEKFEIPNALILVTADSDMAMLFGFLKTKPAIHPPMIMPNAKIKFHDSAFQSYLKNLTLVGMHMAQMCRNEEEMPNALLPNKSKSGIINPISGPVIYQGQGCINMLMFYFY